MRPKSNAIPRSAFRRAPPKGDEINLFPKSKTITLYYSESFSQARLVSGTGFITKRWSVNGLFDVNLSGVGHKPYLFNQFMDIYQKYNVIGSKITVTQQTGNQISVLHETGDVSLSVGRNELYVSAANNEAATGGIHAALCEQGLHPRPFSNQHAQGGTDSIAKILPLVKLTTSWNKRASVRRVKKIADRGSTAFEPQKWWGDIANNPTEPATSQNAEEFRLYFSSNRGIDPVPDFHYNVCIAYKVKFTDLKTVATS